MCQGNICFESSEDMISFKELFDGGAHSFLACDVAQLRAKIIQSTEGVIPVFLCVTECVCVCVRVQAQNG